MKEFVISVSSLKEARKARKKEQKQRDAENLDNGLTFTKSIRCARTHHSLTDRRERARPRDEHED